MDFSSICVSYYRNIRLDKQPLHVAIAHLAEYVRSDENLIFIDSQAKKCFEADDMAGFRSWKKKLPCSSIATLMEGGHSKASIVGFTGLCMCDFDHLAGDDMEKLVALVNGDPHTVLSFRTVSGHGIRVVSAFEVEGKPLSQVAEPDYLVAFHHVNQYYSMLLGVPFDAAPKDASRVTFLTHDPNVFFNEKAVPFAIHPASLNHVGSKVMRDNKQDDVECLFHKACCLVENRGVSYAAGHNNFLMHLVPLLNRMGLLEVDVTALCIREGFIDGSPDETSAMVSRLYSKYSSQHGVLACSFNVKKAPGPIRKESLFSGAHNDQSRRNKTLVIKEFISNNCDLRFNTLTSRPQFFSAEDGKYVDVNDNYVNSLYLRILESENISFTLLDLYTVINSDFVPSYDPLVDYLNGLPAWSGDGDPLADLFACVDTPDPELLCKYGKKWFVGMIECWMGGRSNQIVFELIGRQNIRKSTFMSLLLPPELSPYFVQLSFSPYLSKDEFLRLAQYGLLCFDEMGAISDRENAVFKHFVTTNEIDVRPSYGRISMKFRRVASLCATSNTVQFLTDTTGDRRHLPFIARNIHLPDGHKFPYEAIYAQALALSRDPGFVCYLTDDDIKELDAHMRQFRIADEVEEAILAYFRVPTADDYTNTEIRVEHLSATEIRDRIALRTNARYSIMKVGNALNKMMVHSSFIKGRKGYNLVELLFDEVKARRKSDAVDHYLAEQHECQSCTLSSPNTPRLDDNDDLFDNNE